MRLAENPCGQGTENGILLEVNNVGSHTQRVRRCILILHENSKVQYLRLWLSNGATYLQVVKHQRKNVPVCMGKLFPI